MDLAMLKEYVPFLVPLVSAELALGIINTDNGE
jgi:hypothetical protein